MAEIFDIFEVKVEATENGSAWRVISNGQWQLGGDEPLQLFGDPVPRAALDAFLASEPAGGGMGGWFVSAPIQGTEYRFVYWPKNSN